jgi:hypothetical protein
LRRSPECLQSKALSFVNADLTGRTPPHSTDIPRIPVRTKAIVYHSASRIRRVIRPSLDWRVNSAGGGGTIFVSTGFSHSSVMHFYFDALCDQVDQEMAWPAQGQLRRRLQRHIKISRPCPNGRRGRHSGRRGDRDRRDRPPKFYVRIQLKQSLRVVVTDCSAGLRRSARNQTYRTNHRSPGCSPGHTDCLYRGRGSEDYHGCGRSTVSDASCAR